MSLTIKKAVLPAAVTAFIAALALGTLELIITAILTRWIHLCDAGNGRRMAVRTRFFVVCVETASRALASCCRGRNGRVRSRVGPGSSPAMITWSNHPAPANLATMVCCHVKDPCREVAGPDRRTL
jgi:hypothetical protein